MSLERLSLASDGRIAYKLKLPGRRGETHRLMQPMEFMARLAALVPPPRYPLVRFAGVLAPHSSWRAQVVPAAPDKECAHVSLPRVPSVVAASEAAPARTPASPVLPVRVTEPEARSASGGIDVLVAGARAVPTPASTQATAGTAPVTATTRARRSTGASKLEWATLLKRTHGIDVLRCIRCGARARLIATITEPSVVKAILDHVGLPSNVPVPKRARAPTLWEA